MQVEVQDHVIIVDNKDKKYLVRVTSVEPYRAIICDQYQKTKEFAKYVEFERDDVIANLGKIPRYGMSYGLVIERIRIQLDDLKPWDSVKFYRKHNETEQKLILKSLNRVAKQLEESKIFPKEKPIEIHVKDIKGPHNGMYHHFKKKDDDDSEKPDIIDLRVKDFAQTDYLLLHETAHGVWFQLMDDKIRARWIRAFTKNISLLHDIKSKIIKMRKELIETGTIKAYMHDLDEQDKDIFEHIIKYIKKNYNLKPLHINILMADDDDLLEVWPQDIIPIPQTSVLVSKYATTDPEELFCEAFAYYFTPNKDIPKSIKNLMEKTISLCRYGSNSRASSEADD